MGIHSVLITGCNRGLGLEMLKQMARSASPPDILIGTTRLLNQELDDLKKTHANVNIINLDLRSKEKYPGVFEEVQRLVGDKGLNLLVNNAGIAHKSTRLNFIKWEQMMDSFEINTVAPLMFTKAMLPLLAKAGKMCQKQTLTCAGVVNMSSILGSIEKNDIGGLYSYRSSKAALNAITKSLSIDLKPLGITCIGLHPGWVKTDMGGKNADLEVTEAIKAIIRLFSLIHKDHSGKLIQYDGTILPY